MLRPILCILLLLGLSAPALASSTYRCNSQLVSLGADSHEVRSKCGEPVSEDELSFKRVINQYGHSHELRVTEWVYGPKGGMYYFLRFEGGNLAKISSSR